LVQKAKSSNADVFIALSLPNDGALMAKTVQQVGYKPEVLLPVRVPGHDVAELAGPR